MPSTIHAMHTSAIIDDTVAHLHSGHVILYPTDTVWGLGCDPYSEPAVDRIFRIKQRSREKAFLLLVDSLAMLQQYVPDIAPALLPIIDRADAPLTVVYTETRGLPPFLLASDGSIGIRIVQQPLIAEIIKTFGKPLVSTSANTAGKPTPSGYESLEPEILDAVDFCLPAHFDTGGGTPSRMVALDENGEFRWIR